MKFISMAKLDFFKSKHAISMAKLDFEKDKHGLSMAKLELSMARLGFSKKISMTSLDFLKNRQNLPYKAKIMTKKAFFLFPSCL